jgi:hypothetical protein
MNAAEKEMLRVLSLFIFLPTYPTEIIAQIGNGKMPMEPIQQLI